MNELLNKLSSYNIFNYLLPGVVFSVLGDALTSLKFIQSDIIIGAFFYYFIGLIISRIGSLAIEPILKSTGFVKFSSYCDFVEASKKDEMIKVLSESNNMYRTFCSLFTLIIIVKIFELTISASPVVSQWATEFVVVALLLLFLFSYRKQTEYITKRIRKTLQSGD